MNLLPNEITITQSDNGMLTLTNWRIIYESKWLTNSTIQTIELQHVTGCELKVRSPWQLLLISFVAGCAFFARIEEWDYDQVWFFGTAIFLPILLVILFTGTVMIVSSPSAKIIISVRGLKKERRKEFINSVDAAQIAIFIDHEACD